MVVGEGSVLEGNGLIEHEDGGHRNECEYGYGYDESMDVMGKTVGVEAGLCRY